MRIGRMELWARLGRLTLVEEMFDQASTNREEREWREFGKAPHGVPWWGSFHGSSFPGDHDRTCERALLYGLVGAPEVEPFSQMLRGTMIVGQAAEDWRVEELDLDGRLLSPPNTAKYQMRFQDADHWLSASPDIVVLPSFSNRPHLVETKTKDLPVVVEMKNAQRSYDAKQARQCRVNIALGNKIAHELWPSVVVCSQTWRLAYRADGVKWEDDDPSGFMCRDHLDPMVPGACLKRIELLPMTSGTLLYMGRDRPHVKHGYFFEHDEDWFQKGIATLERAQGHFDAGTLPEHPFGGKDWSQDPCKYCNFKREVCKPDHKAKVATLADSNVTRWATEVHGGYDLADVERKIKERWAGKSGYQGVLPSDYNTVATAA